MKNKTILNQDRLIFALDVPNFQLAQEWIRYRLGDSISFYKIGLELILSQDLAKIVDLLLKLNKKIFLDCKLFDIPETIKRTIAHFQKNNYYQFITIHGNDEMLKMAVDCFSESNPILSVLHLTSLDQKDMQDLGFNCDLQSLIQSRAKRAHLIGCTGIVCAPSDLQFLSPELKNNLILVNPGIRNPNLKQSFDDHKRSMSLQEAFDHGSDYLVIGRPIREAKDPYQSAWQFQQQIQSYFHENNKKEL